MLAHALYAAAHQLTSRLMTTSACASHPMSMPTSVARSKKYEPLQLVQMFRLAAELRTKMLAGGFTDNGGAIHSAERILNILGLRIRYPALSHINNLRKLPDAPFSVAAFAAFHEGRKVLIEHVSPHRELTRAATERINRGVADDEFLELVRSNFALALLTEEETTRLNHLNRSTMQSDRLARAGIELHAAQCTQLTAAGMP